MRNIKLTIEYNGTDYAGWQIQNLRKVNVRIRKVKTIQETIEKILKKILQEKIKLIASGRTDAGVHAVGQVANFKTGSDIKLCNLQKALNSLLPGDIVVTKAEEVKSDFHSRFDAKSKIYRYIILNDIHPSALLKDKVCFCPYPLNIKLMRQETRCLLGRHNFKSFCASGSNIKNTIRTIKKISIKKIWNNLLASRCKLIIIDIEADGFLYNMVRNIVGTLVDIGKGRFKKGSLEKILLAKNRECAGRTVPAKGLFLVGVNY